jgi:hypothetical protein
VYAQYFQNKPKTFRGVRFVVATKNRFHRWRKNPDSLAQIVIMLFAHGQVADADSAPFGREALWRLAR